MHKISTDYYECLLEDLKDLEEALGYLNELISEYSDDDEISKRIILRGFGNVANAQGGFEQLAEKTGICVDKLSGDLSLGSNPRLSTMLTVVNGFGFQLNLKNVSAGTEKKLPKRPVKRAVLKRISRKRKQPLHHEYQYGETCRV